MRFICIFIMSIGYCEQRYILDQSVKGWIQTLSVPWVGVLSYQETKSSKEVMAGVILISTKLAIGNAYEVANIRKKNIRNTTKAMFLTLVGKVQHSAVTGYMLHPEYDRDTLKTLALINLDYDEKLFNWVLMDWPRESEQMNVHQGNIYALGYVDNDQALLPVMYKMEHVNMSDCDKFYKKEKLDIHWMAPTKFQCFRKKYGTDPCVFQPGMALAVYFNEKWKLLGISVLGPGCGLPARFIDFARYVPWVLVTAKLTRRDSHIIWPDYDKVILEKLDDGTIVMRPYVGPGVIYGDCTDVDGDIIYEEEGYFEALERGVALYEVSIGDKHYSNITCITLRVGGTISSLEPFEDLAGMVKTIPYVPPWDKEKQFPTKTIHKAKDGTWFSWWHLPKDNAKVPSVVFKFEYFKEARLSLTFYGINTSQDNKPMLPYSDSTMDINTTTDQPEPTGDTKHQTEPRNHFWWHYF